MVFQSERDGCGKSAVRTILKEVYKDEAYDVMPLSSECKSFAQMQEELFQNGVYYDGIEVFDVKDVQKKELPCICQIRQDDKYHFVVLTRRNRFGVTFFDPQFGKIRMKKDEFKDIFLHKCLVKERVFNTPNRPNIRFLFGWEILAYVFLFLLQCLSMSFLFYTMSSKNAFLIQLVPLSISAILFLLQNVLNHQVLKRLEKGILFPYLKESKNEKDYSLLMSILTKVVKRSSLLVTYSLACVLLFSMLFSNGIYVMLLGFIALLFPFLEYLSLPYTNKLIRKTCLEDEKIKKLINKGEKMEDTYKKSKKIASSYKDVILYNRIILVVVLSLIILMEMAIKETPSLNYYLFYLFLSLSVSQFVQKLLNTYLEEDKIIQEINALSRPLSSFLLKKILLLGYTNKTKGDRKNGKKKKHPRLPGQHQPGQETKEAL